MTTKTTLRRVDLLRALERVRLVLPNRSIKPILQGVHLATRDGRLYLTGTDGSLMLTTALAAEGALGACVVPCEALLKRLKASSQADCELSLRTAGQRLVVRCGAVTHELQTLPIREFPPLPGEAVASGDSIPAEALRTSVAVALKAVADTPSRYAIDAILLESDAAGARLAATDGRRMVIVELGVRLPGMPPQTLLPRALARLLVRMLKGTADECVSVGATAPASDSSTAPHWPLTCAGVDWRLWAMPAEGKFPDYRDVLPASASKFSFSRRAMLQALHEVAGATSRTSLELDLMARRIRLSAGEAESGVSRVSVAARFAGGGDDAILTAFHPAYFADALDSLSGESVVIDVAQNTPSGEHVASRAALLYAESDPRIRWVVMPVARGLIASRESLGSNYVEPEVAEPTDAGASALAAVA